MLETLGRKFARFTTNQVVRRPWAWRLFRGLTRAQFNRIAPAWDERRSAEAFAPIEVALDSLELTPKRVLDLGTGTGRAAFLLARRYPEAEVVGVDLAELGPAIEPGSLARLEVPKADISERRIRACCLYVDRFGNMQLNLTRSDVERLGAVPGTQLELELASERYYAVAARTFADARDGEVILYEDAYENIAIAISGGSAAQTFSAHPGVDVRITLAP